MSKQTIQEKVKERLNEAYQEILSLKQLNEGSDGVDAEERIKNRISQLEKEKSEIDRFYEELIVATEEKAEKLKEKFDERMEDFNNQLNDVKSAVK